jgi:hypothetical protein
MKGGTRSEDKTCGTLRTSEFGRAEHRSAGASVKGVRPTSRLEGATDLPGRGRLWSQFKPACSERTVESLPTRICRCRRGLEVRQICTLIEAAHVGTRDVPSTWDRFRFCDGINRHEPPEWRTRVSDDRGGGAIRKIADWRAG